LGISSVAFGFAFRDVLQNYLAGILLLLDGTFQIGDQVLFNNAEGTIEDIQTRATLIRTYDGRLVVVPNGMLFTGMVTVTSARRQVRSEYDVTITKAEEAPRADELVTAAVPKEPDVLSDPAPRAFVQDIKGQGAVLRIQWWTQPGREHVGQVRTRVLLAVRKTLREAGIEVG
jgi:small conductance mechanosensitive channel